MAKTGLKYPVAAPYTAGAHTAGKVIGKAISASASINVAEGSLYADDGLAESVKEFTSGTITVGLDEMDDDIAVMLLGHTMGEDNELVAKDNDFAPYVGVGFYGARVKDGKKSYKAIWYPKVQFKEPNEDLTTKGENITFGTYTIEGTLMRDDAGEWRRSKICDTEEEARAWLEGKAKITA